MSEDNIGGVALWCLDCKSIADYVPRPEVAEDWRCKNCGGQLVFSFVMGDDAENWSKEKVAEAAMKTGPGGTTNDADDWRKVKVSDETPD